MNKIAEIVESYSYQANYSNLDECYVSECVELGIMAHGDTKAQAIAEIKEATRVYLLMMEEDREALPAPIN